MKFILFLAIFLQSLNFDCNGHTMVAQIAQASMDAPMRTAIDSLLAKFGKRGMQSLADTACWMDEIKTDPAQADAKVANEELYKTHFAIMYHNADCTDCTSGGDMVAWHQDHSGVNMTNKFDDPGATSALSMLNKIGFRMATDDFGKSNFDPLLFFVATHIFGDLAQPLHTMNLAGRHFGPSLLPVWGIDAGGNFIKASFPPAKCSKSMAEGCLPVTVQEGSTLSGATVNPGGSFKHKWNMHRGLDTFFNLFASDKAAVSPNLEKVTAKVSQMCEPVEVMQDFSFKDLAEYVKNTNLDTFEPVYKAWQQQKKPAAGVVWAKEDVMALNEMLFKKVCIMGKSLARFFKNHIDLDKFNASIAQSPQSGSELAQSAEVAALNELIPGLCGDCPAAVEPDLRFRQRSQTPINK